MIRFIIADDHGLSASGMAAALAGEGGVVIAGMASNGIEAIALIKAEQPDCAVIDLTMPGANGLEVFLEAKRWSPDTRFAIVTGNHLPGVFKDLVDAGVQGIFMKSEAAGPLIKGILAVAKGDSRVSTSVQKALDAAEDREQLTSRELEILHSIARGLTNNQMAERFAISAKTIDTHRTNLMRKLGVHSTAALLVRAMRLGLIDV